MSNKYLVVNSAGKISGNSVPIPPADGGSGVINGTNNTVTFTGNFPLGLTLSATTNLTLPTSGTLISTTGATMTGAINEALLSSMAIAGTMNIGASNVNYIIVTAGTGPITAFDSITAGARRFLRFSVATSITYNASTMLLPGSANLIVNIGDVLEFVSGGGGIWWCVNIQPWGAWPISLGGTGATTAAGATAMIIASLPAHYQRDIMWSSNRTTIISPNNLTININNSGYILTTQQTINLATAASWDSTAINYTVAANRAGKDFYIYACQPSSGTAPMILLSSNSTVPTGYTSTNSRKIGGFHCLCTAVGTISGHTLSGYLAGDILPVSIWDLNFRPVSNPEGMVFDANTNRWVDIYLSSVANSQLVSVNNGVTADGASSPVAFHWYNGSDWIAKAKKNLLSQREFVLASMGSNQGTNIAGNSDPNTTGGHVDTAGQRMISNIGCEDMCGALWQWGSDVGGPYGTAAWKNAFDGNDTGVGGSSYEEPTRGVLGGYWNSGANCGSRASAWNNGPLSLVSYFGLRGRAEPLCGI